MNVTDKIFDEKFKRQFRDENCNIVVMSDTKAANVEYGSRILNVLQPEQEFTNMLNAQNWAITQTIQSNIILFDLDTNDYNKNLDKFFNRRRDKYVNHSEQINSRHGFIKVTDADHQWCVGFAKKFHIQSTIEIYAEKHWVVFAGLYVNNHNEDDPTRKTQWYFVDDSSECIIKTTKEELENVFRRVQNTSNNNNNFDGGPQVGERNSECFKVACDVFEKRHLDYTSGLNFIKTWNKLSSSPLDNSEVKQLVQSAWDRINNKDVDYKGKDKIDNVAFILQKNSKFITLRNTEELLLYNGKIYDKLQAETIVKEDTEKLIPNCSTHDRFEVINKIKTQTYSNLEAFDSDSNLITIKNGILNLEKLELTCHTPSHLSRVLLPVEYAPPKYDINNDTIFEDIEKNLKDTLFWKTLKESFTIDGRFRRKDFETVLEIVACPIVKRHVDEKAFMFLGSGENGKSVFLSYIENLIGEDNVSNITLQDIADDKFMRANLDGMSVNIFTDLEQNELRHTGKIKAITSNEGIEVQRKYQQGFTLHPFCKLMFSCNRFPKVYDQTQGFFRRWIIIKWERNFENDPNRIEYLKEKLVENKEEKNLVFSCLVPLANKLNRVGKFTHSKDWKTIQKEWNANADPVDDFDVNYIKDSETHKTKRETYQFYKSIMLEKGETPLGMGQFSKAFEEYHDYDRIEMDAGSSRRTERVWLNIDFIKPQQITLLSQDVSV